MPLNGEIVPTPRPSWRMPTRLLALGVLALSGCEQSSTNPATGGENDEPLIEFELTSAGAEAASTASLVGYHKLAPVPARENAQARLSASVAQLDNSPFDLTYYGGRVLSGATSYNVFLNCPEGPAFCWGTGDINPTTFLRDLNNSSYINIVQEYTGRNLMGRFPVLGMRTNLTFANPQRASLQEIYHILSDAVTRTGHSGYGAIYHVFLRQGTEVCITEGTCYSPSDPSSWTFCAFHGSVNFGPRHVLFTVEPYQAVPGCQIPGQTPNGVIDATASTLAHELFETITDPDFDGWVNGLFGFEISDMCTSFGTNQVLGQHQYFLQSEYSNRLHLCTDRPAGV
jgi:hypothetical protein